jgi:NADPH:quinone reductase-like Zn-dependent oxidoreductase
MTIIIRSLTSTDKRKDMKAFTVDRYGKKSVMRLGDVNMPIVGDAEVLVQVHAASVNLLDAKVRNGEFKLLLPYRPPFVLGHDVAGVVVEIGKKVTRFKPGDEVYSRPDDMRTGTFAEFVAVREASLAQKPKNLSMEEAAAVPLVALTAWQALVEKAQLKKGQKIFIQAGSGGVGTIAIQLAKHLGATVATTTSTGNVEWVQKLGADVVVDYKKNDAENVLSDVVLNSQDASTLKKSLGILKPGGKLISISGPPDPAFAEEIKAPWMIKQLMRALSYSARKAAKKKNVSFSFLFMKANGEQLQAISTLIEAGAIRPVVDKIFPFEAANEALSYVESGRAKGKVVIKVR